MSAAPSSTRPLRLLAGSGRSGTTWLQDVLCEANNLHPVFEPFHPQGWDRARPFSRKYLSLAQDGAQVDAADAGAELEQLWRALLEGNYPATWIDFRVRPNKLRPSRSELHSLPAFKSWLAHWRKLRRHRTTYRRERGAGILVKTIRANLLLPSIAARANTHWTLVLRHPGAVVESQLRLKGVWDARRIAALYRDDAALEARLGRPWSEWIGVARSDAELFTLMWCLENLLPLEDVAGAKRHVLFYESLAADHEEEWDRLLDLLALARRPQEADLKRPSQQSSEVMGKRRGRKKSWRERLGSEDRAGIQRILDLFEVSFYHTDALAPKTGDLGAFRSWRDHA